jgi:hypothetical protein
VGNNQVERVMAYIIRSKPQSCRIMDLTADGDLRALGDTQTL